MISLAIKTLLIKMLRIS